MNSLLVVDDESGVRSISKPFSRAQLTQALERSVEWHRERVITRARQVRPKAELHRRRAQLTEALAEAEKSSAAAIDAMLMMVRIRDVALHDHSRRVCHLAVNLALAMGVTEPQPSDIERGALLHDIG